MFGVLFLYLFFFGMACQYLTVVGQNTSQVPIRLSSSYGPMGVMSSLAAANKVSRGVRAGF